jgi:hypothetical protein
MVRFDNENGPEISFTTDSVPAFIIEGMVGEAVTAIFQQVNYFNELFTNKEHPKHNEWVINMKSLCAIAFAETEQVIWCLRDMKDATLSPRHKAIRNITKKVVDELQANHEAILASDENNDQAFTDAMALILKWLKSSTLILSSYTKQKDITAIVKDWK